MQTINQRNLTIPTPNHCRKVQSKSMQRAQVRQLLLNTSHNNYHHRNCHTQSIDKSHFNNKKQKIKQQVDFQTYKVHEYSKGKSNGMKSPKLFLVLPKVKKKLKNKPKTLSLIKDIQIINKYMNIQILQPVKNKKHKSIKKYDLLNTQDTNKYIQKEQLKRNIEKTKSRHKIYNRKKIKTQNRKFPTICPQNSQQQDKLLNVTVISPFQQNRKTSDKLINITQNNLLKENDSKLDKKKQEWKQINAFQLQTQFFKLKKIRSNQTSQIFHTKNKLYSIPQKQKITTFITQYKPEYSQINILQLIKSQNFKVIHDQQQFYFGQTQNNKKQGKGILILKNIIYEGLWQNNQILEGIQKNKTGFYKGTFFNRKRSGRGQYYWGNGQYYNGQWKNGKKNGSGYWKSHKQDTYMGEWKDGQVTGYGVHTTYSGQRYEGQFVKFLKHGFGRQSFPNGDQYQGLYVNGNPEGNGRYYWKCGIIYDGNFKQGFRQGKGRLIIENKFEFEGRFERQIVEGEGRQIMENGDQFKGLYKDGKRNGIGILTLKEQRKIYKGNWVNNKLEEQY